MPLYLLDALSAEEMLAVSAHVQSGCPRCAASLAEAQAVFAQMSLAIDPVAPPPALREKLLARVSASRHDEKQTQVAALRKPKNSQFFPWGLAAAASIAAVCLGVWGAREQRSATELSQSVSAQNEQVARLQTILAEQQDRVLRMQSPSVQMVSLQGAAPQPTALGRLFVDRKALMVDFAAAGMAPPPPGKTYELWVVTPDQKKIPVGTFNVNAKGEAFLEASVPTSAIALAAVTDEPALMPQPTGHFQMTGAVEVIR